jgi:hypothetical protein
VLFWITWVIGFTFIKSFGKGNEVYFGWFSYYLVTLPVFIAHTYLVAYLLVPKLTSKKRIPLFVVSFLLFFYVFSVIELVLSNEFIYKWYPTGSEITERYLSVGNVVRSGVGNLYIVFVFLAAKIIRDWTLAQKQQKELEQIDLEERMARNRTRVQPYMLLFAVDQIERMVERSDPEVSKAIAVTSELLSEVMIYQQEGQNWIAREIDLVKKLLALVELFKKTKPEFEFFISGDPSSVDLPQMILFSFVDLVIRRYDKQKGLPEMNIEVSGYSNMVAIQMLSDEAGKGKPDHYEEDCMETLRQFRSLHGDMVVIDHERHTYGCTVLIRSNTRTPSNGGDTHQPDVGSAILTDG